MPRILDRHVEQYKDNLNTLPNEEPSELKFSIDIEEPSLPPLWVAAQKGDVGGKKFEHTI